MYPRTHHSIPERDRFTYRGIQLERKQFRAQSLQAANETMTIKSENIIGDEYWESQYFGEGIEERHYASVYV